MDKIGFWNIRRMNMSRKRKEINFFLKNNEVGLFGLLETKIKNKAFLKAVDSFDSWCISTNNGYHSGGRIWVLWKPSMSRVQFKEYNAQFIHMKIDSLFQRSSFFLTLVYAFNDILEREPLWSSLRRLSLQTQGPWAIVGDFNCVLRPSERVGGNVPSVEMEPFKTCVEDRGVFDITSVGALFTWNNKQKPESRIYSRIDRFLVNKAWSNSMPDSFAHFMPEGMCDHTPCIVSQSKQLQRKRSFKYFNMWGSSKKFLPLLHYHWDNKIPGSSMFKLVKNLKLLKPVLKELNKDYYNEIEVHTEALELKIRAMQEELRKDPSNKLLMEEEYNGLHELKIMMEARASFLAQKAKMKWIEGGDTNTAFFHGIIKSRRAANSVYRIEDRHGKVWDSPECIKGAFLDFYQQLLGNRQETSKVHKKIMDQGPRCTKDMNGCLLAPDTGKEIKDIIFSIPDNKSPGLDDFTSKFYKDAWMVIGEDVIATVQEFFRNRKLLSQVNATNIVLIPKIERPVSVQHFRRIACCNLIYKVISKLICNRLATVLPHIIDQNQGAFIQGRNIQDNIMICQDLIRLFERPNSSPRCLFKIDLQKAYDTVEWHFVEQMLEQFHLPM
ncbi:hypothetical protein vseg_003553 [Gypsophila vaccaria]